MTGFVYAIQTGDAVKIGWGADPVRRLSELNVGSPGRHKLLGFVVATKGQERELHTLLSPWRIRGEWFSLSKVVAHFIDLLPPFRPSVRALSPSLVQSRRATLETWLSANDKSHSELAAACGVSRACVGHWVRGVRTPRQEQMQAIIAATNGAVTPNDFLPREAMP